MTIKNILQKTFSITNIESHKQITILGLKIKFQTTKLLLKNNFYNINQKIEDNFKEIKQNLQECNYYTLANNLHSNLEKYRGCHQGEDIVIIGGGHSLKDFIPIKNAIYMGINRAYKFDKITLDYLFASDQFPEGMEDFINYDKTGNCKKFITYMPAEYQHRILLKDLIKIKHEKLICNPKYESRMPCDIAYQPLGSYWLCSTTFFALQLALYTLPKRIYLVGCDCTSGNIYRNFLSPANPSNDYKYQLLGWNLIKEDINNFYPEIEIISVNPIGLKGYFKDIYTQSFVDKHSELKDEKIEIMNKETLCYKI